MDQLQTTLALLKFCDQDSFKTVRLSNSQKSNPHGEKVVAAIREKCGEDTDYTELESFIKLWRVDFLETMKPKYLPRGWNIEHKMQRSFGEHSVFKS
mmetsp:Transcript_12450/g.15909  ORF Transcript_12450/g.15909 Transcript_12450/m.15909 type:complete len:97 (+) Transcript_12450:2220-2510(+)